MNKITKTAFLMLFDGLRCHNKMRSLEKRHGHYIIRKRKCNETERQTDKES